MQIVGAPGGGTQGQRHRYRVQRGDRGGVRVPGPTLAPPRAVLLPVPLHFWSSSPMRAPTYGDILSVGLCQASWGARRLVRTTSTIIWTPPHLGSNPLLPSSAPPGIAGSVAPGTVGAEKAAVAEAAKKRQVSQSPLTFDLLPMVFGQT